MKFILVCVAVLLSLSACGSVVVGDSGNQLNNAKKIDGLEGNARTQAIRNDLKLGQITGVDIEHLFALLQDNQALLVDCRPSLYYRIGHIDGALNLPYRKSATHLDEFVEQLDKGLAQRKLIILYCQNYNCPDAYLFAKKLSEIGYSSSVYKGGWQEWKESGL